MLNKWLQDLLNAVLRARASLDHTVEQTADGCDVSEPVAERSAYPKTPTNGNSLALPDQSQTDEAAMKDILQAKTLRALTEAVELHARSTHGAGILTNFVVIAETVDPNLDNDTDKRSLCVLTSADMTSWLLLGMTAALNSYVYSAVL